MPYEPIAKRNWRAFVESFSRLLVGRQVELEIVGLDLGDQIEAEWLPLRALTLGDRTGRLHVRLGGDPAIDHAIEAVEIWAELVGSELRSLVVIDTADHKDILRFRAPLELPSAPNERGKGASAP